MCIARTLVMRPRLILLDEPFGALDQQTRLLMGDELLRLWRESGATVMLITHAIDEAVLLADRVAVMSARPGRIIDLVATDWPRDRSSRIVTEQRFGSLTARVWEKLRAESHEGDRPCGARRTAGAAVTRAGLARLALGLAVIAALELACRAGFISRLTFIAPSEMAAATIALLGRQETFRLLGFTLANVLLAIVASILVGLLAALFVHRRRRLRLALDPFLASYYAVPFFVLYPIFVAILGLNRWPLILIGFVFAVPGMFTAMLDGLDGTPAILFKIARMHRMSHRETFLRLVLPAVAPSRLHRHQAHHRVFVHRHHRRRVHPRGSAASASPSRMPITASTARRCTG